MAVQTPPILLAITMGGITYHQILAAQTAMFAYVTMLAGVGLLLSTISLGNRVAAYRMTIMLLIYWLVPMFCSEAVIDYKKMTPYTEKALTAIAGFSVFQQIGNVLTTGFEESAISFQVVTNLIAGIITFCASWFVFDVANCSPQRTDTAESAQKRNGWLAPGRPKIEPIVWKDFYFRPTHRVQTLTRRVMW